MSQRSHLPSRPWPALLLSGALLAAAGCSEQVNVEDLLSQAKDAMEVKSYSTAEIHLKNALAQDPDLAEARRMLAELNVAKGRGDAAEIEADKATALGVSAETLYLTRLRALMLQKKYQEVIDTPTAIATDSADASTLLVQSESTAIRGHAWMALGETDKAVQAFDEALALDADSAVARVGKAQIALKAGEIEQARTLLQEATTLAPDYAPGWSLQGDLLRFENRAEEAEAAYSKAIETRVVNAEDLMSRALLRIGLNKLEGAKADIDQLKKNGYRVPHAAYAEGLMNLLANQPKEASERFTEVLSKFPDYINVECYLGASLTLEGKVERASAALDNCERRYPQSLLVQRLKAAIALAKGDVQGAERLLAPLAALTPPDPYAAEVLAKLALEDGEPAKVVELLQGIAQSDLRSSSHSMTLGVALARTGDVEAAREAFSEAAGPSAPVELVAAQGFLRAGRLEEARKSVEAHLAQQPNSAPALNLLGIIEGKAGNKEAARKHFEAALAASPEDVQAMRNLAKTLFEQGERKASLELLERALQRAPNEASLLGMAVAIDVQDGRIEQASKRLEAAVEAAPANAELMVLKARFHAQTGGRDEARRTLAAAIDRFGESPAVLRELANLELQAGDFTAASQTLERLTKRSGAAEDHVVYSFALEQRGDAEGARRAIEAGLAMAPENPALLIARVRAAINARDAREARSGLEAAREHVTQKEVLLAEEGRLALLEGRNSEAVKAFEQALAAAPSPQRAIELASVQGRTGATKEAFLTLERARADYPDSLEVGFALASAYAQTGRRPEARAQYEAILAEHPEEARALNNLAWLLRPEDPARALELAERAYKLAPESAGVLDTLAMLLLDKGETARATELLRRAASTAPNQQDIQLHLAMALLRGGERGEARQLVQQLDDARLSPESVQALDAIRAEL